MNPKLLRLLMKLIKPASLATGGAAVLIFLVFWLGPSFGLRGAWLLLVVLGIMFVWLIIFFILRIRAQRAGKALEKSIEEQGAAQQASTRPDREQEIEDLRHQFLEALEALKRSRVGKSGGGTGSLYVLPWYMIIGPPAVGKTTLLDNSGLNFPYLDAERKKRYVRGIGGTRNCDWWFADEAVILDTAGRYVLPVEADDTKEWLAFLDMLRKFRGRKPLNGLVVGVSVQDLVTASEDELEEQAQKIRARVDELIDRLGISFPVYVVFTKCDLIRGFMEFFGDLSRADRASAWGATVARDRSSVEPAADIFRREMDLLAANLERAHVPRAAEQTNPKVRPEIVVFPRQFAALKDRLANFLEILFQDNPYHERPVFRGFYFTSGTQEGRPIDQVINAMLRGFGITSTEEGREVEPVEKKSYFIDHVFTKIAFPDRHIAGPSAEGERRKRRRRARVFAAGCVGLALLAVALFVLSAANRKLLSEAKSLSLEVVSAAQGHQLDFSSDDLGSFERFRSNLVTMEDRSRSLSKILHLGTFQGEPAAEKAREVYLRSFYEAAMYPVRQSLAVKLSNADSLNVNFLTFYEWYRAWRVLQEPERLGSSEADPVSAQMAGFWASEMQVPLEGGRTEFHDLLKKQVEYCSRYQLTLSRLYPPATNRASITERQARIAFRNYWTASGVHPALLETGKQVEDVTVVSVVGGDAGVYGDGVVVPGTFTREAWEGPINRFLTWLETQRKGWVIREAFLQEPRDLRDDLLDLYGRQYASHWKEFLAGVEVQAGTGSEDTKAFLERCASEETSPVIQILKEVERNTRFESTSDRGLRNVGGEFSVIQDFFREPGLIESVADEAVQENRGSAPYLEYMEKLLQVAAAYPDNRNQVLGLRAWIRNNVGGPESDPVTAHMARLLDFPAQVVTGSEQAAQGGQLQQAWGEVRREFNTYLRGRFPFDRSSRDQVGLPDFERFFGPGGTYWSFYEASLSRYISRDGVSIAGSGLELTTEFITNHRRAYRITRAFFAQDGALGFGFALVRLPPHFDRQDISIRGVRIDVGGEQLSGPVGPPTPTPMAWPGPNPEAGALLRLDVRGVETPDLQFPGSFGLFQLVDLAASEEVASGVKLTWRINAGTGEIQVPFIVRGLSSDFHPFQGGAFRFSCPGQLVAGRP